MLREIQKNFALPALLALAGCSTGPSGTYGGGSTTTSTAATTIANLTPYATPTGTVSTYTMAGQIDTSGSFFQALVSNTRTCQTCHQLAQGMSLNVSSIQALFSSTAGTDALFDAVDGANCPTAATGSASGHSLILNNGLIRIAVTVPATAQFKISVVTDPYGCALSTSAAGAQVVSVYRRPLPSTTLPYLSSVMWDTRETLSTLDTTATFLANREADLTQQGLDAVSTHEQGATTPAAAQVSSFLAFEQTLYTAQATDTAAGSLSANGATAGAASLASQNYYPGINDAFGGDPTGAKFNPQVFTLFQAWANNPVPSRASIANGEQIFNTAPMTINLVRGINDNSALGSPVTLKASCGTCHDAPNVGHHSLPLPMDTAIGRLAATETDPSILAGLSQLAPPSLPVHLVSGCVDPGTNKAVTYTTTDPGKALISGLCADVDRVKLPILRGLSARAPDFHNGSAANLAQLVNFYNARFQMKLNPQQMTDLVAFLNAL